MSFFAELKRRNVFRVGIAYVLMGWVLLQAADFALDLVDAPNWVIQVFVIAVLVGLPIALFFAWAYEMTPEGLKREREIDRTQSITSQTGKKLDRTIIGLLALAVVYLLLDKFLLAPEPAAPPEQVAAAEPAAVETSQLKSIAVLPFANMSEDPGNEFFSDGISEEILNALARVEELKVAGRTSSFAFKGRNEDLRLIGETLGVNHILEGSVRKAGNKVRITAQLIQVEDGFHLWSDTYDRELTDIFAIQDEIAGAILRELKAELIGIESIASSQVDTQAYEKYLLAKQRIYNRTTQEIENAAKLLTEAIDIQPDFAAAWAQRGIVSMLLSEQQYGSIPIKQSQQQARLFLEKSLELDDSLAEGWAGMGLYFSNEPGADNWQQAVTHLERALDINPSLINASNWLQLSLTNLNQTKRALTILEDMFERDPLYRPASGNLVFLYFRMGQMDRIPPMLDRIEPFFRNDPDFNTYKAMYYTWSGDYSTALPLARMAYERDPSQLNNRATLGLTLMYLNEQTQVVDIETAQPFMHVWALRRLGRMEEATMLARSKSDTNPGLLIELLVRQGKYAQAVNFVEERWADLEAFARDWGGGFGFGSGNLAFLAKAYLETGNPDGFEQALALTRQEIDQQISQGADTFILWLSDAQYWTLMNEQEKAIALVERAVTMGGMGSPRLSEDWFLLKPLEGHPRFEAAQQQMLAHLNRERVEAGLEPLEPGYSL